MTAKRYRKLMRAMLTNLHTEYGAEIQFNLIGNLKIVDRKWVSTGEPAPKSYQSSWDAVKSLCLTK